MKISNSLFFFLSFLLFFSCSTTKLITKKERKNLQQQIEESPIFTQGFTGFQLYDPIGKTVLHEQFADKYFTPASNTKIFTFYTAAKILDDSIPALKYIIQGDSLIFWGTGDPSLLHPHLPDNQNIINFLNNRPEQLFYCGDNFMNDRLGAGWMWDDYPYYYQVELAALPIYGNFIRVQGEPKSSNFNITPGYFTNKIQGTSDLGGSTARFYRQEKSNLVDYNGQPVGKTKLDRELPFLYQDSLAIQLLQDSVNRPIQLITGLGIAPQNSRTIYSVSTDSVLQRMMQISDNFLAEQLILLCANTVLDTLKIRKGIQLAKDALYVNSPDKLLWYDGSGLSRYNQFTPRSIIYVLDKIYHEMPMDYWQTIFPAGGATGTIKNYFGGQKMPYVYAKSGSIRNVRCLSGFVLTKSGKTLLFSFMSNAIPGSSRPWNEAMEKVLSWIHEEL